MSIASDPFDFQQLSVAERILLVERIWDSIAAEEPLLPLTSAQKEELDRRLEAYRQSPDQGSSWEEVRTRLRAKT
jgi:putative addiction module component (TIGR02574 family)